MDWKSKLDVLNNKIKSARNLQKHLDIVSEKVEKPKEQKEDIEKKEEKKFTIAEAVAKRQITREKALINTIANIPAYKSSEYHMLDLINKKTKNLDPLGKTEDGAMSGLVHQSHIKFAKRRLAQIMRNLMKDVHKIEKENRRQR